MSTPDLFESFQLGSIKLSNRMVMAPLTRSRAGEGNAPTAMNAKYYGQRASAGLIIGEASQVSQQGQGYLSTPGCYTAAQVEGWKLVTAAVHARGGHIFQQMWHVGRVSHITLQPDGKAPISSTEQAAKETFSFAYDENGKPSQQPTSKPTVATIAELHQVTAEYAQAAKNLNQAGFDGVEIHGANGYLFDQHLHSLVNQRTDAYGAASAENRARLLLETFDAVAAVFGAERTGVRISPFGKFADMGPDPKVEETFFYLGQQLVKRGAAYVHFVRGSQYDAEPLLLDPFLRGFRAVCDRPLIVTGRLDKAQGEKLLADGLTDLVDFGIAFLANPDLVERLRSGWPLNTPDESTFYGGTEKGYTDYPTHTA